MFSSNNLLKFLNLSIVVPYGLLLLAIFLFSFNLYHFWPFTADDTFITFRYSQNLASGFGITFNANQPHVEGYTSFLWVIVMAIPHLFGIEPVLIAKFLGVVFIVISMFFSFKMILVLLPSHDENMRLTAASMGVLMISACRQTAIHAVSGMDTALFTFLLVLFFFLLVKNQIFGYSKSTRYLIISGLLLGLTRPEGNLFVLISIVVVLLMTEKDTRKKIIIDFLLFYIIPGLIYFSWRYFYYQKLLPLPFYVKTIDSSLAPGLSAVKSFYRFFGIHVGVLILLGITQLKKYFLSILISVFAFSLFYIFPKHMMGYAWRFLFPVMPIMFVVSALGLAAIQRWLESEHYTTRIKSLAARAVFISICLIMPFSILSNDRKETWLIDYSKGMERAHFALGKKLASLTGQKKDPVLAIDDAGVVPYLSKWKTIDLLGLNTPEIISKGKYDPDYVLSKNPDVVVFVSHSKDDITLDITDRRPELLKKCVESGMEKVQVLEFNHNYYLWILARPETIIGKSLSKT